MAPALAAPTPIWSGPDESVVSWFLFDGPGLRLGILRLPAHHPRWRRANRAAGTVSWSGALVAFPSLPVRWRTSARRAVVLDNPVAIRLDADHEYRRDLLDARGERTDFVLVSPERAAELRIPDVGPVPGPAWADLRVLVRRLERGGLVDAFEIEETLLAVLARLGGRPPREDGRARRGTRALAEDAKALLATTAAETTPLHALAGGLGVSAGHLVRTFRRETGLTLHGYRDAVRLRRAVDGFAETSGTGLAAVALANGFCSHAHFAHRCRRHFGRSPSALRDALARA